MSCFVGIIQLYNIQDWKSNSWRHLSLDWNKDFDLTASKQATNDPRIKEILQDSEFKLKQNNIDEKINYESLKSIKDLELLKNPKPNDLRSLIKDVSSEGLRAIYDPKNNNVYFWDANSRYLHEDVMDYLNWPTEDLSVSFYVETNPLRFSTYEETGKWFKEMLTKNKSFKDLVSNLKPKIIIDINNEVTIQEILQ
jgi:hypothetical protein